MKGVEGVSYAGREAPNSLDSKLAEMERRFGVIARWTPTDKEFVDVKRSSMSARRDQLHTSLWASVVKRHYLLQMKAKYAGIMLVVCCETF